MIFDMFSRLLRALSAPPAENQPPDPLASLREQIRQRQNAPLPSLSEETDDRPPTRPDIPLKLHQFKGMSCFIHAEDNPGRNFAGGFACHRPIPEGRQILAVTPCLEMDDDCRTLRDQKLRSQIVGVEAFRKGHFPHQDHGIVYWILSGSPDMVDYDYFWEERPGLILHLSGNVPRDAHWEPAVRFAAATMRGQVYRSPVLVTGLALERQDDGGVSFHFSDPDPHEPLHPQSFQFDSQQFAHWLETCTLEAFRLQQDSDTLVSQPNGVGVELNTSDHYGPHLSALLGPEDLKNARQFLPSE